MWNSTHYTVTHSSQYTIYNTYKSQNRTKLTKTVGISYFVVLHNDMFSIIDIDINFLWYFDIIY